MILVDIIVLAGGSAAFGFVLNGDNRLRRKERIWFVVTILFNHMRWIFLKFRLFGTR